MATATQMIAKTNGAVLPTQTIVFVAISLQMRKKMTRDVKNTHTIMLITTAPQMIEQLKAMETRTKKITRAKKTTGSPVASVT